MEPSAGFFPQLPLGTYRPQNFAPVLVFQAYYDSDVDLFTWGTPVTAIALFTFLLHLGIETKTWVSHGQSHTPKGTHVAGHKLPSMCFTHAGGCKAALAVC